MSAGGFDQIIFFDGVSVLNFAVSALIPATMSKRHGSFPIFTDPKTDQTRLKARAEMMKALCVSLYDDVKWKAVFCNTEKDNRFTMEEIESILLTLQYCLTEAAYVTMYESLSNFITQELCPNVMKVLNKIIKAATEDKTFTITQNIRYMGIDKLLSNIGEEKLFIAYVMNVLTTAKEYNMVYACNKIQQSLSRQ